MAWWLPESLFLGIGLTPFLEHFRNNYI